MVSDVDDTIASISKRENTVPSDLPSHQSPQNNSAETEKPAQPTAQAGHSGSQTTNGSSTGKWLLGIAAAIGLVWLVSQSDNHSSSGTPNLSESSSEPRASGSEWQAVAPQPQSSGPAEEVPSVGANNVLTVSQIQYCLAEKIRLGAADAGVDKSITSDVDRYNSSVDDYNSRCGNFRYRRGDLESAQREIEPLRGQLEVEGRGRFSRSSYPLTNTSPPVPQAVSPSPDNVEQEARDASNAEVGIPEPRKDNGRVQGTNLPQNRTDLSGRTSGQNTDAPQPVSPRSRPSVDRDNFQTCISGNYPALCKHSLLNDEEVAQVRAAELRANYQTCISGNYPALCKHSLLTSGESSQVEAAELRENYQTCISGNYPALCKHSLLTGGESSQVEAAELRENYQTCISGNYPALCKNSRLTSGEATQVKAAERRANFQTCISGDYPALCNRSLLTEDEAVRVTEAERRARAR